MKRFIGIDPHMASCTLGVVSESGKRVREMVVETNGEALVGAVASIAGDKHVCIEEGTYSAWLYEILTPHVSRAVVAMPHREGGGPRQKSDSIDAYGWADKLRTGTIRTAVYKAPGRYSRLRELCRVYRMVTRQTTQAKNRVKAMYRSRGIQTPGRQVYGEEGRQQWLKQLPSSARDAARLLHETADALEDVRAQTEKAIVAEAKQYPEVRRLRTIPGIGKLWAAMLVTVIITPQRFRTVKQFLSYCGLGIVMRTSSDWVQTVDRRWARVPVQQTRGLTRRRHGLLKEIMKSAATTAIGPRAHNALKTKYEQLLSAGTKPNLAKLTVARKIAAIVLRVLKEQQEYQDELVAAKKR